MQQFYLESNNFSVYKNLAVENYLTNTLVDTACLFLWQNDNTVVIGKNQNPYAECNLAAMSLEKTDLARRTTGGGAVYHDVGNLNFSFIVPKEIYDVKRQLSVIANALLPFGIIAEYSGRNDLIINDKKISGNAFLKSGKNYLHHGTVLINTNFEKMTEYLNVSAEKLGSNGVKSVKSRVINVGDINKNLTLNVLKLYLMQAFEREYGKIEIIDFDTLSSLSNVQQLTSIYSSSEYIYGNWQMGEKTVYRYDWGCATATKNGNTYDISTDCMYPNALEKAKNRNNNYEDINEGKAVTDIKSLLDLYNI